MLKLKCNMCKQELNKTAAILWSWPDAQDRCKKTHLCRKCYKLLMKFIRGESK